LYHAKKKEKNMRRRMPWFLELECTWSSLSKAKLQECRPCTVHHGRRHQTTALMAAAGRRAISGLRDRCSATAVASGPCLSKAWDAQRVSGPTLCQRSTCSGHFKSHVDWTPRPRDLHRGGRVEGGPEALHLAQNLGPYPCCSNATHSLR